MRKYSLGLFIAGTVMELVKRWYILVFAIVLAVMRGFSSAVPATFPVALLFVWVIAALVTQFKYMSVVLNAGADGETNELLNKMFADNGKGYKNIIDTVDEKIKEHSKGASDEESR